MKRKEKPRIIVEGGHVRLESRKSDLAVDIFVTDNSDGGLYFELSAERGSFRSRALAPQPLVTHIVSLDDRVASNQDTEQA